MNGARKASSGGTAAKRAAIALSVFILLAAIVFWLDPAQLYLWIKAVHVMAVMSWMAGMLYLPRLFIYHCGVKAGSEASETFKIMEQRLLRVIINPAMVIAWALGLYLAWAGFAFIGVWLWAKLAMVLALSAVHGYFAASVRAFSEDRNRKSAGHWRLMNEAPTVLMIAIVIMVIVKPFV